MNALAAGIGRFFDLIIGPLADRPALAMVVLSVLTAVWSLLLFKATTRQERLTTGRDRLFGHLYEMGLYQDHLNVMGRIQRDLALANLRYLWLTLPALLALTVPMVITLAQLDSRYAHRPLQVGESTVFVVRVHDRDRAALADLKLVAPDGVRIEAGPVLDRPAGEAAWRLRLSAPGPHLLRVLRGDEIVASRKLNANHGLPRLAETQGATGWRVLLAPGSLPLPAQSPVVETRLQLPERSVRYLGFKMHWLLAFMIFSLIGGYLVKDPLRVSI